MPWFDGGDDLVVPVADDAHAQFALAAEIGEDGGLGDAQALRDLDRRGSFVAVFGEDLAADAQDVADALLALGAGRGTARDARDEMGRDA